MLIATIILSYLLFMSLIYIIIIGIEDRFKADEWIALLLFIFAFPVFVIVKLIFVTKSFIAEKKRRKRVKELQELKKYYR